MQLPNEELGDVSGSVDRLCEQEADPVTEPFRPGTGPDDSLEVRVIGHPAQQRIGEREHLRSAAQADARCLPERLRGGEGRERPRVAAQRDGVGQRLPLGVVHPRPLGEISPLQVWGARQGRTQRVEGGRRRAHGRLVPVGVHETCVHRQEVAAFARWQGEAFGQVPGAHGAHPLLDGACLGGPAGGLRGP